MILQEQFPDAELVLLDLLEFIGGNDTTVTHTDDDLTAPCIQIQRVGGADDLITDRTLMQVTCYGSTRAHAWELAREAQQVLLAAAGTTVTGDFVTNVLIDYVSTSSANAQLPYENPDLRVVSGTYRVDFRRPF